MRLFSLLAISSSIILLCTSLSIARDNTRWTKRRLTNDKLDQLRARIIAARRARLLRYRQSLSRSQSKDNITISTSSAPIIKPSCAGGCICLVTNDVRCNRKSLKRIPRGLPNNVNKLDLGMNNIITFKRKDFSNISATLRSLYLHNNSITFIGNGNFVELKKLQLLRLSHNKIREIRKSSLQGMKDLQSLYLDHNKLSVIHPLAFRGLTKLRTLQLERNLLSQIHKDLFITFEFDKYFKFSSINRLNLQNNQLRYLPRHVFDHVTGDISVSMGLNPWDCSCQSTWLKQKILNLTRDRCGATESATADCPICASPDSAKDRPMSGVAMTCSHSPQEDIDTIQAETDQVLFQNSGSVATEVSLLFASNDHTVLVAKCSLIEMPSTIVREDGNSGRSFSASFEGIFRCVTETLDSTSTAETLMSYEDREFSLISRKQRDTQQGKHTERYAVEEGDQENPFTDVSITTESDYLLNNQSTLGFLSNDDSEQANVFNVKLSTSFIYNYDPKKTKFSKKPWVLIRNPDPSNVGVTILQSERQVTIKCKVVGQPKPNIAWVLPSGEIVHAGKKAQRHAVQKSGKITIRSISGQDSGIYRCVAIVHDPVNRSMIAEVDIAASKIHVVEPTKDDFSLSDVSPETHQETIEKGEIWTSQCHIESLYDAATAWVTPDNRVLVGDSTYRHGQVTSYQNGTISVTDFKKANEGLYRCVGVNVEGEEEYSVYISLPSDEDDSVETMLIDTLDYSESDDPVIVPDILPNLEDDFGESEEPNSIETNVIPGVELDLGEDDMDPFEDQIIDEVISDFDIPSENFQQNQSTMTIKLSSTTSQPTTTNNFIDKGDNPMKNIDENVPEIKTPDLMAGIEIDLDDDEEYYDEGNGDETLENENIPETTTPSKRNLNETQTQGLDGSNEVERRPAPTGTSPEMKVTRKYSDFHHPTSQDKTRHPAIGKSSEPTTALKYSNSNPTNHNEASHAPVKNSPETTAASKYSNFLKTPTFVIRNTVKIDSTYRTHLKNNNNDVSLPTQSVDTITQPQSPKFGDGQTRRQDFDFDDDEVTLPEIETASKPNSPSRVPVLPTQQERISSDFKPSDQYLELKAEPDGTAAPVSPRIDDFTVPVLDGNFGFRLPGVDLSLLLSNLPVDNNETSPTQMVDVSKGERLETKVSRTQIDPDVDSLPDIIDPGILFPDSPTADPTASTDQNPEAEHSTSNDLNPAAGHVDNSTSKEDKSVQKLPELIDPGLLFPDSPTSPNNTIDQNPKVENAENSDSETDHVGNRVDLDAGGPILNTTDQDTLTSATTPVYETKPEVEVLDVDLALTTSATHNENSHQVIDSDALIPDIMYDTDSIPSSNLPSYENDMDTIDGDKEPTENEGPINQGWPSPVQNDTVSLNSADVGGVDEPELDIGKAPRSSKLSPTTSSTVLLTNTTLATTKQVTTTTDADDFEETMATSPQSRAVSSDTTTDDIIEPPIVTVAMPTSHESIIEEDPSSVGVYEILDMPAGKITRRPAIQRLDRNEIFGREHGRVLLPCMPLDVSPLLSWTFTWTLPSGDVYTRPGRIVSLDWSKYIHRNGSLLLTRLEREDGGNYDCVAVNRRKNVEYHTHVSLEILERLRIRNPKNEYVQVKTGSDVMIPCDVTGSPHPSIIWETPWGATLDDTSYIDDLEVLWNGTLRIFNMKPGLRGSYICYAKNGHDLQMRTVTISIIMQRPIFINPTSGMVAVRPGGRISLECKAEGYPEPTIQWILAKGGTIRPNEAIFSGSRFMPKFRVQKDGTLIIRRANDRDIGNYHCVITNYLGRSASTIKLVIGVHR